MNALSEQHAGNFASDLPPEVAHKTARSLLTEGDLARAEQAALNAVRAAPNYAEAFHTLTQIHLAQRNLEDAIKDARAAIAAAPTYAEAHLTLAKCLSLKGDLDGAIAAARAAIAAAPNYAEALCTLGQFLHKARKHDEAELEFRAALAAKGDYVEAMNSLGMLLHERGRLPEAEEILRKAVSLNLDYANAHNNLGFVLRDMGRSKEAAASFRVAHDLFEPHLVLSKQEVGANPLWQYVRISGDIARWKLTGTHRHKAWTDYRMLHCRTNGRSSDFFSNLLKRFEGANQSTEWRASTIFPWVTADQLSRITDALDRDGIYFFDQPVADNIIAELSDFAHRAEADLYPLPAAGITQAKFNPDAPLASGYYFKESQMLEHPEFQRMLGDPLLLAVAHAYFGCEPKLAYLAMWWSAVFVRTPLSDMAQLFHADLAHTKWLKTFVYLTDVDKGTGPHCFVRGSHKSDEGGHKLRSRGLVRFSDEDIHAAYGDRVIEIEGRRGTAFIADTRGFHKAALPRTNHRLLLQVYHVNSLYPDISSHNKRTLTPRDSALIETIRRSPGAFAAYDIANYHNE